MCGYFRRLCVKLVWLEIPDKTFVFLLKSISAEIAWSKVFIIDNMTQIVSYKSCKTNGVKSF